MVVFFSRNFLRVKLQKQKLKCSIFSCCVFIIILVIIMRRILKVKHDKSHHNQKHLKFSFFSPFPPLSPFFIFYFFHLQVIIYIICRGGQTVHIITCYFLSRVVFISCGQKNKLHGVIFVRDGTHSLKNNFPI